MERDMMDLPWILGTLGAIGFFAFFEKMAFDHPNRVNTLSRAIATIGKNWPMSIWIMGVFCGAMAAHLFWLPWANPIGSGGG